MPPSRKRPLRVKSCAAREGMSVLREIKNCVSVCMRLLALLLTLISTEDSNSLGMGVCPTAFGGPREASSWSSLRFRLPTDSFARWLAQRSYKGAAASSLRKTFSVALYILQTYHTAPHVRHKLMFENIHGQTDAKDGHPPVCLVQ